ncbi:unnamed protein product [Mytilus edulis]|uniref:Uncharacterized protein n=1 Tax=Mytilus edulis TaxID=6550 RepID=A0A8S3UIX2_MYTED|nr:unnamed protein product [Mytilus edulis]
MDESSDIVTFGPSTKYNLKDKQEQRDDLLELFKGQLNEFNHSLVRGFDVMSNQMQNLIGIMSRKTDDSQDMSRRQMADPINRVEANSNVENRQERNIAHNEVIKKIDRVSNEVETLKSKETRSQEFNGNNRNYDIDQEHKVHGPSLTKATILIETEEQIINIPQEAKPMVQIDMTRNKTATRETGKDRL